MKRSVLLLVLLAVMAAPAVAGAVDLTEIKHLVVLHEGRRKPFDTYARETIRFIFEDDDREGQDAIETALSILADPGPWAKRKFLPVTSKTLAKKLFEGRETVSPAEVVARSRELEGLWRESRSAKMFVEAKAGDVPDDMRRQADEAMELGKAAIPLLMRTKAIRTIGVDLLVLPVKDAATDWLSIEAAESMPGAEALHAAWTDLLAAFRDEDRAAFSKASTALLKAQHGMRPSSMPSRTVLDLEVFFNAVMPRTVALLVFGLISVLFLVHAFVRRRFTGTIATLALVVGILANTYIISMRTLFAGRLPLRNTNEVFLVVLWFVPVIAIFLQGMLRNRVYGGVAAALSLIGYIGAMFLPPSGYEIRPLVAILNSGWREIHILSIMLSYAILFIAVGIHCGYIIARFREGWDSAVGALAKSLDHQAYHVLAWGFLFLTIGIATGAAWGNAAWGRYWGWDPKEVWATVAWAIYGLFLHLRLFRRWRGFPLAVVNIVGFGAIMFTYFGVTYLLSGLHSYGAS